MITALALYLVHCVVQLPMTRDADREVESGSEVMIATSLEKAIRTANSFISAFLEM